MRPTYIVPIVALITSALVGCGWMEHEDGTGAPLVRALEVAPFHGIAVRGSLEVRLTPGEEQAVEVEGQPNLIDLLNTHVKDGIWHIETRKAFRTTEPFIIHITTPTMQQVSVQGSGGVRGLGRFTMATLALEVLGSGDLVMDVEAERIDALIQGSGDIDLRGTCNTMYATVLGSGDIDASALVCGSTSATVQGSGDISTWATERLMANIGGSGDIRYAGQPKEMSTNIAGSGEVKPLP